MSCVIPVSWDCDGQVIVMILVQGTDSIHLVHVKHLYSSWDCDGQGNCYDPVQGMDSIHL